MSVVIEQAEKKKKIFDMMVSMHSKMRDSYNYWNNVFDCLEILASVLFCGVTFFDFRNVFSDNIAMLFGIVSILFFSFTIIKQRLNFKSKAEQHRTAAIMYAKAKIDIAQQIILWEEQNTTSEVVSEYIANKYDSLSELVSIPEKRFHRLKHHHL